MKESFKHLNQSDRDRLEALLDSDHTQTQVACILNVNKSTISREVKKRKRRDGHYEASTAQQKAYVKRKDSKYQGMKVESSEEMKTYIIEGLKQKRSPDEIAGRMKKDNLSFYASKDAIYHWLYSIHGQKYSHYLCTQRYKPKKQRENKTKRTMIPDRISIDLRPLGATNKTRYKHFEVDTAVAPKRSGNTEAIAIAIERKSKLILGKRIPSLKNKEMTKAIQSFNKEVHILSLTGDNGIENRDHKNWRTPTFFADPHSPWQKPMVENSIGLLRRWFYKKGTNWAKVSEKELQEAISILNNKYRKSLNYLSAMEVALAHDIIKIPSNKKSCN